MEHQSSLAKDFGKVFGEVLGEVFGKVFAKHFAKCLYRETLMFPESIFWYKRTALQLRISFPPVMNQKSTHPF